MSAAPPGPAHAGLRARSLTCVRGERCLFEGLDLDLLPGRCLHVVGENGAGKTSLLRILAGLLPPTEGTVAWRGLDVARAREELGAEMAFVGHLNGIKDDLTVGENLAFARALRSGRFDAAAARGLLEELELADFLDAPARHLSQGQKRRVALARLCASPEVRLWILDEPFNALDARAVAAWSGRLEAHLARGGAAVLTAHQALDLPAVTDRLALEAAGAAS